MHRRGAILEAVGASGVLRHVAADTGDGLTRRIRGKVIPTINNGLSQGKIHQTRLYYRSLIGKIDLQDPVHAVQPDDHPALNRNGATR